MNKNCKKCGLKFEIADADKEFYKKLDVPEPALCPSCREQRRLVWRNEWKLYKRKSDLSGEEIISYISPDKHQRVFSLEEWFSEKWDPRMYGRGFDFSRPFFEQFKELLQETPHIPLLIGECENCEYTNYSWHNKACYMVTAADYNEDSFYSSYLENSKNCMDCFFVHKSELCYECIDCDSCYSSIFCQKCKTCTDCANCFNCQSLNNCIGCINLRHEQYCIFNKKYSKEDYQKKKAELTENPEKIAAEVEKFKLKFPQKYANTSKCEKSIGNNLTNCKNCFNCFDLIEAQDCRYVIYGIKSKDTMDANGAPEDELCYETVAAPQGYNNRFCTSCWIKPNNNLTYCHLCRACHDLFGCVSMHRNSFCILNKQYSEEEYRELVPRIIDHMKKTGEWGEFFPIWTSPFCYNETAAMDYYPISRGEAVKKGYPWKEEDRAETAAAAGPDIKTCKGCLKNFRLIPQELKFYKTFLLAAPDFCPFCRHKHRLAKRLPRKLWPRECSKCGADVQSPYEPSRPEIIYCEKCWLELMG